MSLRQPKVSVVIATYCSGDGLRRVMDSLDAQSLPQSEFEVILVDDGSPDDTYGRLLRLAESRTNVRVAQVPHSGWPSRPRNVGTDMARGDYIVYMDHDDSLFPQALERAYAYAVEHNADLVCPKESKTNSSWWAMQAVADGNVPNALVDGGIGRLDPMVPHKLYRRALLEQHSIRFPEGGRVLWEDIFVNVAAYRHSKVVSVLADTPFYLWHAGANNASYTFNPQSSDFWDRLEDLLVFIDKTLQGAAYHDAHTRVMAHQVGERVIGRTVRLLNEGDEKASRHAFSRARRLLGQYMSDNVFRALTPGDQAQALLFHAGDRSLVTRLEATRRSVHAETRADDLTWRDGRFSLKLTTRWFCRDANTSRLVRANGRVLWEVDPELRNALPDRYFDLTDSTYDVGLGVCLRGRRADVSWPVDVNLHEVEFMEDDLAGLALSVSGTAQIDLDTVACGARLIDDVWDFRTRVTWCGHVRDGGLPVTTAARPALVHGRPAVAYANNKRELSLDLAQRLRTFAIDAKPLAGSAGPIVDFAVPLQNVQVFGDAELDAAMISAIPDGPSVDGDHDTLRRLAMEGALHGRVHARSGQAWLRGGTDLPPGRYHLYAYREGMYHRTPRDLSVSMDLVAEFS